MEENTFFVTHYAITNILKNEVGSKISFCNDHWLPCGPLINLMSANFIAKTSFLA